MKTNDLYQNGIKYFNMGNLIKAREYFNQCTNNPKFHDSAMARLCTIAEKESNFKEMRNLISQGFYYHDEIEGRLNFQEYNYQTSLKCYEKALNKSKINRNLIFDITIVYVNLGEFDKALKIYQKLTKYNECYYGAIMRMSHIYLLQGDYEKAYHTILKIDRSALNNPKIRKDFEINCSLYLSLLGKDSLLYDNKAYLISQARSNNEITLINHLKEHINNNTLKMVGTFNPDLDFSLLLKKIRANLDRLNPNIKGNISEYIMPLDCVVSHIGDMPLSDISVRIISGTNIIISAFPVVLSDKFNQENLLDSVELKRKRSTKVF